MNHGGRAARVREVVHILRQAERPVRVLRAIGWPRATRQRFFARNARELPEVSYQRMDAWPTIAAVADARARVGDIGADTPIGRWLRRLCDAIEGGARMLTSVGTRAFFDHSRALYGAPTDPLVDEVNRPIDLARELDEILSGLTHEDMGGDVDSAGPARHDAEALAARMREVVDRYMGSAGPEVAIVDDLSANVVAGPQRVRIRRDAYFSDKDMDQLVYHEVLVHVATSLNGRQQHDLPILAAGHPGTTRTQEGLAVFAELITGSMAPDRFRRLADRVLAVQMAIEGADFLDVYRFFLGRTHAQEQAFENARRVFRGGVITGGAPFTKDVVYLDGLLRVHNFLRAVVRADRVDCLRLLFCGKLDLEDVPAMCELAVLGLCQPPAFLPPWVVDQRFLIAYLAYSGFLNQVNLSAVQGHYAALMAEAPRAVLGAAPVARHGAGEP